MKCKFMLWPGSGYCLNGPFVVESELLNENNLELAFELLAAYLIENGLKSYYLTDSEYYDLAKNLGLNPEEMMDDLEGWLYVDGTMEGAKYPIYICTENLRCEFAA